MAITKDDIFKVADEIDAAGQSPTLAAVRKALGGGSFTTISQPLNEWKARKTAKEVVHREAPPAAINDQLQEMGLEIWSQALLSANARMDAERQSLAQTRAEIESARKEAAEMADQVSLELEEARQRVTALTSENQAMQIMIEQLKGELANCSGRAAHAEARVEEISHRAEDLNIQLARVNTQNSELIQALAQRGVGSGSASRNEGGL
jgi:chromosome segregation ATPase